MSEVQVGGIKFVEPEGMAIAPDGEAQVSVLAYVVVALQERGNAKPEHVRAAVGSADVREVQAREVCLGGSNQAVDEHQGSDMLEVAHGVDLVQPFLLAVEGELALDAPRCRERSLFHSGKNG